MSRLRIRMELDRGKAGVPLRKLSSVASEADRFFRMLADDVHIPGTGEWMAVGFESNALNFTVEYSGAIDTNQIREFNAAFGGNTQVRRQTIAQFARIATSLDEDELIVFGLYASAEAPDPSEWRSFSRRDAQHIAAELQALGEALPEEPEADSRIPPPISSPEAGREQHLTVAEERVVSAVVQTLRTEVLQRVASLETNVGAQSEAIETLKERSSLSEQSMRKMLEAVEKLCEEIPKQLAAARTPAPQPSAPPEPVTVSFAEAIAPPRRESLPAEEADRPSYFRWALSAAATLVAIIGVAVGLQLLGVVRFPNLFGPEVKAESGRPQPQAPPPTVTSQAVAPAPQPVQAPPVVPPPASAVQVKLSAREMAWITVFADGKKIAAKALAAGESQTFEDPKELRVLVGNAGGLDLTWNGKQLEPLGPAGKVRIVRFTPDKHEPVTSLEHD